MPVAIRASARTTPVASVSGLSAARGGAVRVSASGFADLRGAYLAVGAVAAGPPVTYADFDSDFGTWLLDVQAPITISFDSGADEYGATLEFPVPGTAFAEADEVWAAIFSGGTSPPASIETPDVVAGPFTVVA